MKRILVLLCGFLLLSTSVSALTIVDLYGDKDGFGLGWTDGYTRPTWPVPSGIIQNDPADSGTITDMYLASDQSWIHTYDISGIASVTSASIEIMTYAQGWLGLSSIYFDGVLVGTLTDGDTTNEAGTSDLNMVRLDTFDLSTLAASLDGVNNITIDTTNPGDWWYLDYSELTITGAPVPEPATMFLFGVGLLGLARVSRKKE